jgi:hypothetical protein
MDIVFCVFARNVEAHEVSPHQRIVGEKYTVGTAVIGHVNLDGVCENNTIEKNKEEKYKIAKEDRFIYVEHMRNDYA